MRRVAYDEPDLGDLDRPLRDLVARALDKQPERRPKARALLLALVGEADDPVGASTRILSSAWTPPPARTLLAPSPTRLDPKRPGRARVRVVGIAAVVALVILLSAWLFRDQLRDPGGGTGQRPNATSTSPSSSPSPPAGRVTGAPVGGEPRTVTLDDGVTREGSLRTGEVHRYRFELTGLEDVYLQGMVDSNLVPWRITRVGGGTIGGGNLGGRTEEPLTLTAGEYELSIGGPNAGGNYAFQLRTG